MAATSTFGAVAPVTCPLSSAGTAIRSLSSSLSSSPTRSPLSVSVSSRGRRVAAPSRAVYVRAEGDVAGEVFQLEVERPYGIKFFRGEDGGIYVDALTPGYPAAKTGQIEVGDKLLATSAVFGDEMWPAAEYGRTMYCIQQRVGPMYMRFEKRNGVKISPFRQAAYLQERAAGNYGDAMKEKQMENYTRRIEMEEKRDDELSAGLDLYREGKYEDAMRRFQIILGLEPGYKEEGVAFYNIACCCAKLRQLNAGLDALEAAMKAGFEDYKKIREDADLSFLRDSDEFDDLLSKYDEPFINENAVKALTSMFGLFGKK